MSPPSSIPTVGIVGGGQLARMMAQAAVSLGVQVRILAGDADEGCPGVFADIVTGSPTDPEALRAFAATVDVLTIDHENVDIDTFAALEAEGVAVRPGATTLRLADKAHQRRTFSAAGIPVPPFAVVDPVNDDDALGEALAFWADHGAPVIVKASRGGYDGRGVWSIGSQERLLEFVEQWTGAPLVLEPKVPLDAEVAVLVARRPSGEQVAWPVVETVQVNGMCDEVLVPADLPAAMLDRALEVGRQVADVSQAVGVLAVELFISGGEVLVNEIAPRVHNSGHFSIDGSVTSQFENHLRAVLDLPLGSTALRAPAVVMRNVVGAKGADPRERLAEGLDGAPEARIHLYGKMAKPARKIGHVNVLGEDVEALRNIAAQVAGRLAGSAMEEEMS